MIMMMKMAASDKIELYQIKKTSGDFQSLTHL